MKFSCTFKIMSAPTPQPRVLKSAGPALIIAMIIAGALLGYYQIVYYPSGHKVTSTTIVPPNPHNATVIIAFGAQVSNAPVTYVPDNAVVYLGYNATVVWVNNDTTVHTVTSSGNSPDPRFDNFGPQSQPYNNVQAKGTPGDVVNFTFITAGTYNYYCSYHSWMRGTVTVKPAPAGLESGSATTSSSSAIYFAPFYLLGSYDGFLLVEVAVASLVFCLLTSKTQKDRELGFFISFPGLWASPPV
jgi:plastocyanin